MDLYEEITQLMQDLTTAIRTLRKNGEKLAEAERDYKITLRKEVLKLKADNTPATLINLIIYGVPEVAEKRLKRDIAQVNYDVNKEYINFCKLRARILENQLSREWSNAEKGDI